MSLAGVTVGQVESAILDLNLTGRPIEILVSLRSFGGLACGAATIVEGVLAAGSTVLAVFVNPDQGLHLPAVGSAKPGPMKLVPPLPKPPPTAMQ